MLTSLIRTPRDPNYKAAPEDIYNTSIALFFPDAQRTSHGEPGSSIIYASKSHGEIELKLADPQGREERWLFAHHLWNASVLVAELITRDSRDDGHHSSHDENVNTRRKAERTGSVSKAAAGQGLFDVREQKVLELGAGAWRPERVSCKSLIVQMRA